jgi:hypothetical protein
VLIGKQTVFSLVQQVQVTDIAVGDIATNLTFVGSFFDAFSKQLHTVVNKL